MDLHHINQLKQGRANHIGRLLLELSQDFHQRSLTYLQKEAKVRKSFYSLMPFIDTNGTTTADIVARSGISKQAVAKTLAQMENANIIYRKPLQNDYRAKIVYFTDFGLDVLNSALKGVEQTAKFYESKIGNEKFSQLETILECLANELDIKRETV